MEEGKPKETPKPALVPTPSAQSLPRCGVLGGRGGMGRAEGGAMALALRAAPALALVSALCPTCWLFWNQIWQKGLTGCGHSLGMDPRASLGPHSAPSQPLRVTRRGLTALSLFLPQVGGDVAGETASGQVGRPHQSGLYSCPQPLHKNTLIPFYPWETGSER